MDISLKIFSLEAEVFIAVKIHIVVSDMTTVFVRF